MIKTTYFIRHGQTNANASNLIQGSGIDQPLSEKGVKQAERLRDRLSNTKFDLYVSSSLKRAKQTLKIINNNPQVPVLEMKELNEISWGDWENTTPINDNLPNLLDTWELGEFDKKAPNGESCFDVEKRSVPTIYNLIMNRPESNIAFVLHGRMLRIVLSSMLHRDLIYMSRYIHVNTTVNIIEAFIGQPFIPLAPPSITQNLDDNVIINDREKTNQNDTTISKQFLHTSITHSEISFKVVVLNSHEHLTPDLI